jgi:hypothetical protein
MLVLLAIIPCGRSTEDRRARLQYMLQRDSQYYKDLLADEEFAADMPLIKAQRLIRSTYIDAQSHSTTSSALK